MSMAQALPRSKGLALVVEDEPTSRLILCQLLRGEGYEVMAAEDGRHGVALFVEHRPDLAFIDVLLPDIDGYEVSRRIRSLAGDRYVPLVFLSSVDERAALVRCVEAGGDDFLPKPCRRDVLRAKLAVIERTRGLYERIARQHEELVLLHEQVHREQQIAEQVFTTAVMSDNVATGVLRCLIKSTAIFNGDIMLSAHTPDGGLCVLLGDFTGHGLAAAIGALPLSQTFHAMCAKGFGMTEMLVEINRKLHNLLPTGMFVACIVIRLEPSLEHATVWNSGMPDLLVRHGTSGELRHRVPSCHPPLGVLDAFLPGAVPQQLSLAEGDEIILCSDGVTEARDSQGELFGEARLERAVLRAAPGQAFESVSVSLTNHIGMAELDDDISLVVVPCVSALFERSRDQVPALTGSSGDWQWGMRLDGARLAKVDPVPLAITQLASMGVPLWHRQQLYTVLSELFSNALEHGVLGLDSALKHSPEGFADYYAARERGLAGLHDGFVSIRLEYREGDAQGLLRVEVEDSGPGFDVAAWPAEDRLSVVRPSGRGILMVRSLCRSLDYAEGGRRACAEYLI